MKNSSSIANLNKEAEIISKRYNFLSLEEQEKNAILKKATKLYQETKNIAQFKQYLNNLYKIKAKEILESEKAYSIITSLLSDNNGLSFIVALMNQYNALLSPEVAKKLIISNTKIKKEISLYLEKNLKGQNNKTLYNLSNETILTLIDTYSDIYKLNIEYDINIDESEYNYSGKEYDGLRILLNTSLKEPLLTKEEERRLLVLTKQGDEKARQQLIMANIKLVVSIAKKFKTLPLEDAIGEGIEGLIIAINKYDIKRNYRLSTYAIPWIKTKVRTSAIKNTIIRVPIHNFYKIKKIRELEEEYYKKNGTAISIKELMDITDQSKEFIEFALNYNDPVSIHSKVKEDDTTELIDFIPDDRTNIEKDIESTETINYILNELSKKHISDKMIDILSMRIGINGYKPHTNQEIAKKYKTTEQNISLKLKNLYKEIEIIITDKDSKQNSLNKKNNKTIKEVVQSFKYRLNKIKKYIEGELTEEEQLAIQKLQSNQIRTLKEEDLEYICNHLIPRVTEILREYSDINYEKGKKVRTIFNILNEYNCSKEIVIEAISMLPEDMIDFLKRRNGIAFESEIPDSDYTRDDEWYFQKNILRYIKLLCRSIKNGEEIEQIQKLEMIHSRMTIREKLEPISDEEYELILSKLKQSDLDLIGINDDPQIKWTVQEREKINCTLIPKLKKKLKNIRNNK